MGFSRRPSGPRHAHPRGRVFLPKVFAGTVQRRGGAFRGGPLRKRARRSTFRPLREISNFCGLGVLGGEGFRVESLKQKAKEFPDAPGVYLFRSAEGRVLYVGKALSLRKRVLSYFTGRDRGFKTQALLSRATDLEAIRTPDEGSALLLESNLIKRHHPRYNVLMRDDKSYPYLKLTVQERFPRVLVSRRPKNDGARYYGPYPNLRVREIVKTVHRYFHLRDCDLEIDGKAERACLSYEIQQCPAPCIGAVDEAAYRKLVRHVEWFLEGRHGPLSAHLKEAMERAAERQEYEEAARLRDLLASIRAMQERYAPVTPEDVDADVAALAEAPGRVHAAVLQVRQGRLIERVARVLDNEWDAPLEESLEALLVQHYAPGVSVPPLLMVSARLLKGRGEGRVRLPAGEVELRAPRCDWEEKLLDMAEQNALEGVKEDLQRTAVLEELKEALALRRLPRTLVCFDISTLQGSHTVGSAVVFRDGVPDKARYRKFRLREAAGPDDYAAHREVMGRYLDLLRREGEPPPDLLVVDGGKGQLSTVEPVVRAKLGREVGLAALAKREEEVFVPGREAPVDFSGCRKARYLLQRLRDESHRFAVGYHRLLRDRALVTSLLREVRGLGPTRLRALLRVFDSVEAVKRASLEDLLAVPGLPRDLAHRIHATYSSGGAPTP